MLWAKIYTSTGGGDGWVGGEMELKAISASNLKLKLKLSLAINRFV